MKGWHVAGAKERQACYDHARGLQGGVEAQLGSVQLAAASGQLLTGAPLAAAYRWAVEGVSTNWVQDGSSDDADNKIPVLR